MFFDSKRKCIHCRGGLNPPEYIPKYTLRSVIGQIQSAPTVDVYIICIAFIYSYSLHQTTSGWLFHLPLGGPQPPYSLCHSKTAL